MQKTDACTFISFGILFHGTKFGDRKVGEVASSQIKKLDKPYYLPLGRL